jgi:hypothetical protein
VVRVETSDGKIHLTEQDARKHCDNEMGDILLRHARKIQDNYAGYCVYVGIANYLEEVLQDLAQAARWQTESKQPIVGLGEEEDDEES